MADIQENCSQPSRYISCIKVRGKPILPPPLNNEARKEMQVYRDQALHVEAKLQEKRRQKLLDKINFVLQNCVPAENFSSSQSLNHKSWTTPPKTSKTSLNQGYNFETHLLTSPNFIWAQRNGSVPFLSQIQPFKYKIIDTPTLRNPSPTQTQSLPNTPLKPDLPTPTAAITNLTQTFHELQIQENVPNLQATPSESRLSYFSSSVTSASTDLNPYMTVHDLVTTDSVSGSPTISSHLNDETRSATPLTVISQDTPTPPYKPSSPSSEHSSLQTSILGSSNEIFHEIPEIPELVQRVRKLSYTLDTPSPVLLKYMEKTQQSLQEPQFEQNPPQLEQNLKEAPKTTQNETESEVISSTDLISQGSKLVEELFSRQQSLMQQLLAQQATEQKRLQELFQSQERQLLTQLQSEDPVLYRSISQSSSSTTGSTPGAKAKRNLATAFNNSPDAQQRDTSLGQNSSGDVLDIHRQRASLTPTKATLNAPSPLLRGLTSPATQNHSPTLLRARQSQSSHSNPSSVGLAPVKDFKDPSWKNKCDIVYAHIKGYLTRRLMRTERVKRIVQTIEDTLDCLLDLHRESGLEIQIRSEDAALHRRLLQQLNGACDALHDVFFTLSISERMNIIAVDRELQFRRRESQERAKITPDSYRSRAETASHSSRAGRSGSLSLATRKTLERKQSRQLSHSSRPSSVTAASVSSRNSPKRRRLASDGPRPRSGETHQRPNPAKTDEKITRSVSPARNSRSGSRSKTTPWR